MSEAGGRLIEYAAIELRSVEKQELAYEREVV